MTRHVVVESAIEKMFRYAALDMGVGDMFSQEVPVLGGRYRFDFVVIGTRLAIELDSDMWHGSVLQKSKDAERDAHTERAGWTTLRFKGSEVVQDARACVWISLRTAHRWWLYSLDKEYDDRVQELQEDIRSTYGYTPEEKEKFKLELEELLKVGKMVHKPPWA